MTLNININTLLRILKRTFKTFEFKNNHYITKLSGVKRDEIFPDN